MYILVSIVHFFYVVHVNETKNGYDLRKTKRIEEDSNHGPAFASAILRAERLPGRGQRLLPLQH